MTVVSKLATLDRWGLHVQTHTHVLIIIKMLCESRCVRVNGGADDDGCGLLQYCGGPRADERSGRRAPYPAPTPARRWTSGGQ